MVIPTCSYREKTNSVVQHACRRRYARSSKVLFNGRWCDVSTSCAQKRVLSGYESTVLMIPSRVYSNAPCSFVTHQKRSVLRRGYDKTNVHTVLSTTHSQCEWPEEWLHGLRIVESCITPETAVAFRRSSKRTGKPVRACTHQFISGKCSVRHSSRIITRIRQTYAWGHLVAFCCFWVRFAVFG